jgi:hypothetical protein
MKYLVSYAYQSGQSLPGGPFLQIGDMLTSYDGPLDHEGIDAIRSAVFQKVGVRAAIIAITKLETP